jgi:hypothetical protein
VSIKKYNLQDILTYLACPAKLKNQNEGSYVPIHDCDGRLVLSTALKDTYIKSFQMFGAHRFWSQQNASAFFSKRWAYYRDEIKKAGLVFKHSTDHLLETFDHVLEMHQIIHSNWELAIANYPTERSFRGSTVETTIDAAFILPNTNKIKLLFLDPSPCKESNNNYALHLKAMLCTGTFKRELGHHTHDVSSVVLNTFHNYTKPIVPNKRSKVNYPKVIRDVTQSIDQQNYYPIANAENCKYCLYKDKCFWRNN